MTDLVLPNLPQSDRPRLVPVRLLDTPGRGGRLPRGLGGELFPAGMWIVDRGSWSEVEREEKREGGGESQYGVLSGRWGVMKGQRKEGKAGLTWGPCLRWTFGRFAIEIEVDPRQVSHQYHNDPYLERKGKKERGVCVVKRGMRGGITLVRAV